MLALAPACDAELSLDSVLQGKRCRQSVPECVDGFVCQAGICVVASSQGAAGTGELVEQGGSSGVPNVSVGAVSEASGGNGGAGLGGSGSASLGGSSFGGASLGPADGGSSGPADPDASAPRDGGQGCTVPLFRDRDDDGFGSNAPEDEDVGCPRPGWVTIAGDCFDAQPTLSNSADQVHPGQTGYFFVGYPNGARPRGISFDYDCTGTEEADPTNVPFGAAPNDCGLLVLCAASGFRPDERDGIGVNSLCGSEIVASCDPQNLQCLYSEVATEQPYRCR